MTQDACQSDRAQDRARQARRTSLLGVGFQGVYAGAQFVILAILIRAVGPDRFGFWITVYAASQWATLAQLGIPKALVTLLSRSVGGEKALAWRATGWVTAVCGALLVVLLAGGGWLPWRRLLQAPPDMAGEATAVVLAALGMALLAGPLSVGGVVLLARQRGDLMHAAAIVGQVAAVALVAVLAWAGSPLWGMALGVMSGPVVGGAGCWALVVGRWAEPGAVARSEGSHDPGDPSLPALGLRFLAVDLGTVALMQSGPIVLAWAREPAAVAVYAAAFRPVGLLMASFTSVAQAYWPAFGEADAAGDRRWLVRGMGGALRIMAVVWLIGAAGILLAGRPFIALWLGPEVVPGYATLAAALGFAAAQGVWVASMALLSGLGLVGRQVLAAIAAVGMLLGAGYGLAVAFGPAGMYAGQAAAALVATGVNVALLVRARGPSAALRG